MAPYVERFPVGTAVRIVDRDQLDAFRATWRYHHPLDADQLRFAGEEAQVAEVGFYHGGDILYRLVDIPGIWHEQHLAEISARYSRGDR